MWTALNIVFGWLGWSTLIGVLCVLVAVFTPPWLAFISNLRHYAIIGAVAAFGFSFVYGWGLKDGLDLKQAEWNAAEKRGAALGDAARDRARRDIDGGVRDRFDRDDN